MDTTLLIFFNNTLSHPILDLPMLTLTLGGFAVLPSLGITLLFSQQRRVGGAILASLSVSFVLILTFQYLALRPRPEDVRLLWPTPNFPSYPSGHAAAAFATATVLGLTYRKLRWWGIALIGAGLVAFSRVYLGLHYPSDILGGAILGAGVGAASYGLIVEPRSVQSAWRWLLWPQVAVVALITQMAYLDLIPKQLLAWPFVDKVLHFVLFGAVVFWLNIWLKGRTINWGRWTIPLAILTAFTIASLEEGLQAFSPLRSASLSDLSSDLAGMVVFWWVSRKIIERGWLTMARRNIARQPLDSWPVSEQN